MPNETDCEEEAPSDGDEWIYEWIRTFFFSCHNPFVGPIRLLGVSILILASAELFLVVNDFEDDFVVPAFWLFASVLFTATCLLFARNLNQ